jgi:hypothetical protein
MSQDWNAPAPGRCSTAVSDRRAAIGDRRYSSTGILPGPGALPG